MSAFPTDILINKTGVRETLTQASFHAKALLAKTTLKRIAERDPTLLASIQPDMRRDLEEALYLIELRCLDLAVAWRRDIRSNEGIEFRNYCSLAFDIRRTLPLGKTDDDRVKGAIRLAAVAVLGDRNSDIRRYLNENTWPVSEVSPEDTGWPKLVLFRVANAFLLVVRKRNWDDLRAVAESIASLRQNQQLYERDYLQQDNGLRQVAAFELVAFYHLAKAVEILGVFVGKGAPRAALDDVDFHLANSIKAADSAGIIELGSLLRWISMAARALIRSTIWRQLSAYNSKLTDFKRALTDEPRLRPLFELSPPQRDTIQEVMRTGNRAVVVEMPTSSGKTLLAEIRIIQTKVNVANAWIAYLAPTRALVNQVTVRLRRDLGPLGFKIEQATPAYELDALEEELLTDPGGFDVLVTTPEKLDLFIRSGAVNQGDRPLGLVVMDEAHNLGDGERGLRSELALATINRESPDTHFLLLTPFIPNAKELANWLDDERSCSVTPSNSINWQPNDQMIALVYPKGRGKVWGLELKPLHVSQTYRQPIAFDERVTIDPERSRDITLSNAKSSKLGVSALIAEALASHGSSIVLAYSPNDCWNLADKLASTLPSKQSDRLTLVREFVKAEYGEDFALYSLLGKGLGVHHSGISPDVRALLEWLTEENELVALVATTTVARGLNFPISNVILSTHFKSIRIGKSFTKSQLRPDEFWNIAGRAGRLFQDTLGLVIFASQKPDDNSLEAFVNNKVVELASSLERMIEDTVKKGWDLDLRRLVKNDIKWSSFVQYLAHSYRKIGDHAQFLTDTEKSLKRTYAFHRLSARQPELAEQLIESTRIYANQLRNLPDGVLTLVDSSGFSPESVMDLLHDKKSFSLQAEDWSPSRLFQSDGNGLKRLVDRLLKIPELNIPTVGVGDGTHIASIIKMWVSGKTLREIADQRFTDVQDTQRRLTECSRMIYQTLTHKVSWGIGALQSMSELADANLSDDVKDSIRSAPSMIYFGVPTIEAVLMRSLGVPRLISVAMGNRFRLDATDSLRAPRLQKARAWLEQSLTETWREVAEESNIQHMDGERMRDAWRVISGNHTL
ncbi:MAG: DEAD/DEAH box helicase [Deltaproteobacteria bacterium]|jgi:superfamily II DNA/RNA helicase|nr:DEAD/DEAH box helicase [Deltaproteobacteria bacterium]